MNKEKIGIGITTYNHEDYFSDLFKSLPKDKIDEIVVVNGGKKYDNTYDCHWIQHNKNSYPSVCRNDCVSFLLNHDCEHIFIIEDDMIIKNPSIFEQYIKSSKESGLKYFSFVSTSYNSGQPLKRTPKLTLEYKNNVKIDFYSNMCNEFTYHHKSCFQKVGLYDGNMREAFDVELTYRESKIGEWASPFWWFADIHNSDEYIENNPIAISRLQSKRPDGSRAEVIDKIWEYFYNKHGLHVGQIPLIDKNEFIKRIKFINERNKI